MGEYLKLAKKDQKDVFGTTRFNVFELSDATVRTTAKTAQTNHLLVLQDSAGQVHSNAKTVTVLLRPQFVTAPTTVETVPMSNSVTCLVQN